MKNTYIYAKAYLLFPIFLISIQTHTSLASTSNGSDKPSIIVAGVDNRTSHDISIVAGGDTFTVPAKKTDVFQIEFPLTTTTPLRIPNTTSKAFKSSGPIKIRSNKKPESESKITAPDLFWISTDYQINEAYGTRWATANIKVEEPSTGNIAKRSPVILASWNNQGKNLPLPKDSHHLIKLNLTLIEKPTTKTDALGKQVATTYIDLGNEELLDVQVEEVANPQAVAPVVPSTESTMTQTPDEDEDIEIE